MTEERMGCVDRLLRSFVHSAVDINKIRVFLNPALPFHRFGPRWLEGTEKVLQALKEADTNNFRTLQIKGADWDPTVSVFLDSYSDQRIRSRRKAGLINRRNINTAKRIALGEAAVYLVVNLTNEDPLREQLTQIANEYPEIIPRNR